MKLEIRSIPPLLRRAGTVFTREVQVIDTAELTDEQVESLHANRRDPRGRGSTRPGRRRALDPLRPARRARPGGGARHWHHRGRAQSAQVVSWDDRAIARAVGIFVVVVLAPASER